LLGGLAHGLLAQTTPAAPTAPAAAAAPAAPNQPTPETAPPAAAAAKAKPPPTAGELQRAAVTQQRAASLKQAESVGVWLMPLPDRPRIASSEPPECDPIENSLVDPLIADAAKQHGLEPKLIRAVIEQESAFRPCAVSFSGAEGLMQLMPDTAADLGVADPFDPKQNVDAGTRYLKQLIAKYKGDLPLALGAYNAGPKTVDNAGGVPDIQETREYVNAILAKAGLPLAATPPAPAASPAATSPQPTAPAASPAPTSPPPPAPATSPAVTSPQPAAPAVKPTAAPAPPVK
jgi:soluble lytic murein transglycosylase-like protein